MIVPGENVLDPEEDELTDLQERAGRVSRRKFSARPPAIEHRILALPVHGQADPVQIGQVLYNVLTNAVQAMDNMGGTLTVRGRRHNGVVRIEVADEGPGIPADSRDRVFEPLFTTKQRGIGLGLSVSRSLAQANGGDLRVGDHGPPGAVFILELPPVGAA